MKNKQNLFQRLLAVMMLVLVMAFSTQTTAKAGFGDFNDYDSSSDWDSSDSWDSDWGSSDYDSYDYDYDDDGGSGEFSPIAIVIGLIIVVYSIIESTRKKNKKTSGTATQRAPQHRAPAPAPADQTEAISQQIKAKDPLFTAQDFLAFAGDVYMDIQSAWEKRDDTGSCSTASESVPADRETDSEENTGWCGEPFRENQCKQILSDVLSYG